MAVSAQVCTHGTLVAHIGRRAHKLFIGVHNLIHYYHVVQLCPLPGCLLISLCFSVFNSLFDIMSPSKAQIITSIPVCSYTIRLRVSQHPLHTVPYVNYSTARIATHSESVPTVTWVNWQTWLSNTTVRVVMFPDDERACLDACNDIPVCNLGPCVTTNPTQLPHRCPHHPSLSTHASSIHNRQVVAMPSGRLAFSSLNYVLVRSMLTAFYTLSECAGRVFCSQRSDRSPQALTYSHIPVYLATTPPASRFSQSLLFAIGK
jgi:hypothetical protein